MLFNFSAEIYDTLTRGTAISFLNFICRFSAFLMPWIGNLLFELLGPFGIFWAFFVVSLISSIGTYLLPKDTT